MYLRLVDGVTTSYVLDTVAPLTMVLAETSGTETIYYLSKHYEEALAYRFTA